MSELAGGCQCGQIRFVARGAPKFTFICQCRSCQHLSGSGHAVQFCLDRTAFEVTGAPAKWDRKTRSGGLVSKAFCAHCGSPLYGTTSRSPHIVMVLAGALDDPAKVSPDRILFAEEAQPWDHAVVRARASPLSPAEFNIIGERLTKALLSGDFELYQRVVCLPFRSVPRDGNTTELTTMGELREDFEKYRERLAMHQVSDIHRDILSITRMADDWIEVGVETNIMCGARRVVEPFATQFVLRPTDEEWRISTVRSSSGHLDWSQGKATITEDGRFQHSKSTQDASAFCGKNKTNGD